MKIDIFIEECNYDILFINYIQKIGFKYDEVHSIPKWKIYIYNNFRIDIMFYDKKNSFTYGLSGIIEMGDVLIPSTINLILFKEKFKSIFKIEHRNLIYNIITQDND